MTHNGRLRRGDEAFLAALVGGRSVRQAAASASISESTAHRRLRDADFHQRLTQAKASAVSEAVAVLIAAGRSAAATLAALLGQGEQPWIRLNAASRILELGSKLRQDEDLERRVAELEARLPSPSGPLRPRRWSA